MPFVDKSTLTYPATNAFAIRRWLDQDRAPTSSDYKNFQLFDLWIYEGQSAWIMIDRTASSGTWIEMASSATGITSLTGDSGGAVMDTGGNINILGGTNVSVAGSPGTSTLTINLGTAIASSFPTDSGTATPSSGVLNIVGTGGTTTSGSGNTVTVTSGGTVPTSFVTDAGTATPAGNILNVLGDGVIDTSGAGDTLTINAGETIATTYTADSGSATPAANNLNIVGSGSTTTSGSGDTITINSSGGGLSWNEVTAVGPTAMAVDMGYVANFTSRVELLLPDTAAFGSVIEIVGVGTGGWQINQNAGETIYFGDSSTTTGASGTIQSSEDRACVKLVCISANTDWAISYSSGNLIFT